MMGSTWHGLRMNGQWHRSRQIQLGHKGRRQLRIPVVTANQLHRRLPASEQRVHQCGDFKGWVNMDRSNRFADHHGLAIRHRRRCPRRQFLGHWRGFGRWCRTRRDHLGLLGDMRRAGGSSFHRLARGSGGLGHVILVSELKQITKSAPRLSKQFVLNNRLFVLKKT